MLLGAVRCPVSIRHVPSPFLRREPEQVAGTRAASVCRGALTWPTGPQTSSPSRSASPTPGWRSATPRRSARPSARRRRRAARRSPQRHRTMTAGAPRPPWEQLSGGGRRWGSSEARRGGGSLRPNSASPQQSSAGAGVDQVGPSSAQFGLGPTILGLPSAKFGLVSDKVGARPGLASAWPDSGWGRPTWSNQGDVWRGGRPSLASVPSQLWTLRPHQSSGMGLCSGRCLGDLRFGLRAHVSNDTLLRVSHQQSWGTPNGLNANREQTEGDKHVIAEESAAELEVRGPVLGMHVLRVQFVLYIAEIRDG